MKLARSAAVATAAVATVVAALLGSLSTTMASAIPGPNMAPDSNAAGPNAAPGSAVDGGQPAAQPLRAHARRAGLPVGTAVDMAALEADAAYRDTVAAEFNSVTAENVMKWQLVEPVRGQLDFAAADELVRFAEEHGQQVYGHTLLWHNQLPTWLTNGVADGSITPDELRQLLRQHIVDQVTHFRGKVVAWDVVNEVIDDNANLRDTLWLRQLGPGYIADAFRWAHEADPKVKLYLNDYNIEGLNAKSDAYHELATRLLRERVPVDGIGIQGHLGVQFGFSNTVIENLRRFDELGLETSITEADVRMLLPVDTVKLQAQARGFLTLLEGCLLTPGCKRFTVWGFTDRYSWVPGFFTGQGAATIMDERFQPKPAYEAIRNDLMLAGPPHHGR